jgi:hypothetical protein
MSRSCPTGRGSKSLGVRLELLVAIAKVKALLSERRPKSDKKEDVANRVDHTKQKGRVTPKQPDGQPLAATCDAPPW